MTSVSLPYIEIDGRVPDMAAAWAAAARSYGHFTAMQVRSGAVRGLDFHLRRLDRASHELFGAGLDGELVRDRIRHALAASVADASVRVFVFENEPGAVSLVVTVRPPAPAPDRPYSLRSYVHQRTLAHVKHLGGFGQSYYGRLAEAGGYDEALFVTTYGVVSEGSITNVGFVEGSTVVWPDAPMLHGITMQVVERELAAAGVPSMRRPVHLSEIAGFDAVFITNSHGVAEVDRVDDLAVPTGSALLKTVVDRYGSASWDVI